MKTGLATDVLTPRAADREVGLPDLSLAASEPDILRQTENSVPDGAASGEKGILPCTAARSEFCMPVAIASVRQVGSANTDHFLLNSR